MDHLWSPWRYQYVTTAAGDVPSKDVCLFCRTGIGAASPDAPAHASDLNAEDARNYVVTRGEHSFVILNRYPYSNGHLMIAPYPHVATLEEAKVEALEEIMRLAQQAEKALRIVYRPEGFNLGFNIGRCAGAGIAGHIHLHVLPRWTGDASFITTVGETRVLPEDLDTTFRRVREAWQQNKESK